MASTTVSLGTAELLSSSSGSTLKLSSYASFASSDEDARLAIESLTDAALTSSAEDRPWIVKGSEYCLMVKLTFDDEMERSLQDEYAKAAAAALQSTRVFEGSLLRVIGVRQSHENLGSNVIGLRFAYLTETADTTASRLHKLADGVPMSDVSVPLGIKAIDCESVFLDMRISSSVRSRHWNSHHGLSVMLTSDDHLGPGSTDAEQSDEELLDSFDASKNASKLEHQHHREANASRRSNTAPTQWASVNNDRQSCNSRRSYSADDCQQAAPRLLELSEFLELFDAAIRLAISSQARRGSKQTRVTSVESLRHLSDIMPSLWSTGYLADMFSRAVLLPTISHALNSVGAVHSRSIQLKCKLDELLRRGHARTHSQNSYTQSEQRNIAQSCLSTSVWSLMQHSLCDRITTVRFGPDPSRQDTERISDPDVSCDSELDGYESEVYRSILDYEQFEPNHNHDTIIANLDEAMGHSLARAACIQRGNCVSEDDMLSLCGSVGSMMDLELDMGLGFDTDTILDEEYVGTYRPTQNTRRKEDDLGEMLSI